MFNQISSTMTVSTPTAHLIVVAAIAVVFLAILIPYTVHTVHRDSNSATSKVITDLVIPYGLSIGVLVLIYGFLAVASFTAWTLVVVVVLTVAVMVVSEVSQIKQKKPKLN